VFADLYLTFVIVIGVAGAAITALMIWLLAAQPGRSFLPIIVLPLFATLAPVAAFEFGWRAIDAGGSIWPQLAVASGLLFMALFEAFLVDRWKNPAMTWQARTYCGLNLLLAFLYAHLVISSYLKTHQDLIENPPAPSWRTSSINIIYPLPVTGVVEHPRTSGAFS
jgi:hypothetical protein